MGGPWGLEVRDKGKGGGNSEGYEGKRKAEGRGVKRRREGGRVRGE